MCLLVVCNPNSTPDKDSLTQGACSNPHGFGFAIQTDKGIISERSMSAKKSIKRFLELREQYPSGYAMWHARYATHGVKNELNCHPFKVAGTEYDTYLAHNGVLNIHIPKGDKRSDTRILAEELLPRLGGVKALADNYIYDMLSAWSSGSKICIMTNDPESEYDIYIINENLGSWDDNGVWWSNNSHKPLLSTPRTSSYYDIYDYGMEYGTTETNMSVELWETDTSVELFECPNCMALLDFEDNEYFCVFCRMCFDCNSDIVECLCYHPDVKMSVLDDMSTKWYSRQPLDF